MEGNIDNAWYQINFGREVEINSVAITIRTDFPHDTHFTSVTIEFSDGKTKTVSLRETAEPQVIELGSIKTSSIK